MAGQTCLLYSILLFHFGTAAVLRARLPEELSPHVALLSSARPFPSDEQKDTAISSIGSSNKYILTFYQNLLDGHSLSEAAQTNEKAKLDEVNTIRSIAPKVNYNGMIFKIPVLGSGEAVQHMELRFNAPTTHRRWLEIGIKRMNKTIKRCVQPVTNKHDLTLLIRPWMSKENKELFVEIKQKIVPETEEDAILVLFTNDKAHLTKLSDISNVSKDDNESHSRSRRSTPRRRRKNCHLSNMHVSFSRLGWGQYIVFPKTYNAKVCKGICVPAIAQQKAVTNHAVMQSLMRESAKGKVPLPCCVPQKLSPLSILYTENDQFLVKHHKDMVAEECGCE